MRRNLQYEMFARRFMETLLMKSIIFIFVLAIGTSTIFSSTVNAEADTFARTTANNLNVRSIANGKSVITQLPRGTVVAILQTKGAWANIVYLENNNTNKPREGWVSSQHLRILYKKIVREHAGKKNGRHLTINTGSPI